MRSPLNPQGQGVKLEDKSWNDPVWVIRVTSLSGYQLRISWYPEKQENAKQGAEEMVDKLSHGAWLDVGNCAELWSVNDPREIDAAVAGGMISRKPGKNEFVAKSDYRECGLRENYKNYSGSLEKYAQVISPKETQGPNAKYITMNDSGVGIYQLSSEDNVLHIEHALGAMDPTPLR